MEKSIFGQLCYAGILIVLFLFDAVMLIPLPASANSENASSPKKTTKLVFIHHSCGENWLVDGHGNLGKTLDDNNYFVSDTNYGWGPHSIGDSTDITDWPRWFTGIAFAFDAPDGGREAGRI